MQPLIVTLDGPAGSGKSTVARQLAQRLGVEFLDTGAMYRGIAALCIEHDIEPGDDPDAAVELAQQTKLRFDWQADPPRLYAGDHDVTDRLRDHDVTSRVSDVAAIAGVRDVLVDEQQHIGAEHPRLVTEGRDQGSVVFPEATVKFFLDASARVRAQRRYQQLKDAGKPADLDEIHEGIIARDRKDTTRKDGPLICPDDAHRIDTSEMTLEQVVELLEQMVRAAEDKPLTAALVNQLLGRGSADA